MPTHQFGRLADRRSAHGFGTCTDGSTAFTAWSHRPDRGQNGRVLNARATRLFAAYADAHQSPANRLTHKIAIPLVVFHIMAMLDWIRIARLPSASDFTLTAAHLALVVVFAFYLWLTPRLAPLMVILFGACIPLGWCTPRPLVVGIALVAWLIQLAGHQVWERRSPAFFSNVLQLLVGPVFFVALLTGAWPVRGAAGQPPGRPTALDEQGARPHRSPS